MVMLLLILKHLKRFSIAFLSEHFPLCKALLTLILLSLFVPSTFEKLFSLHTEAMTALLQWFEV